jgi:hypothetical protein
MMGIASWHWQVIPIVCHAISDKHHFQLAARGGAGCLPETRAARSVYLYRSYTHFLYPVTHLFDSGDLFPFVVSVSAADMTIAVP